LFNIVQNLIYMFVGIAMAQVSLPDWMQVSAAVGFSGVIFSLVAVDVALAPNEMRRFVVLCG